VIYSNKSVFDVGIETAEYISVILIFAHYTNRKMYLFHASTVVTIKHIDHFHYIYNTKIYALSRIISIRNCLKCLYMNILRYNDDSRLDFLLKVCYIIGYWKIILRTNFSLRFRIYSIDIGVSGIA